MGEGAAALKDMAAQLAAALQVQGEKGWDKWSNLQGKLAEVAAAAVDDQSAAVQALLKVAEDASSSQALIKAIEERVSKANPGVLKDLLLLVADELNMTPLGASEPVSMVDKSSKFCQGNVDRIIKCSAELSAQNAPYYVVSIVGPRYSGKSYLLNCLFGTKFPVKRRMFGWSEATRGIMMSTCIGPSLLLLDVEGFDLTEKGLDTSFEKQATQFVLTISDLVIINMLVHDVDRQLDSATLLYKLIFQERTKLPKGHLTKILAVFCRCDEEDQLDLTDYVLEWLGEIWESVNEESVKLMDYFEVNIVGLPDKASAEFPKKDMAAQLAVMLRVQQYNGRDEWINLHRKLSEMVSVAVDDPRTAGQALLKVAKDASTSQYLMRTLEGRISEANPALLKDLVLLVARELNMTPLCDSEPVRMVDEDSKFCGGNLDRIIKCSVELSTPNTPYTVISIIGGESSGKSYLLDRIFGTNFSEMDLGHRWSRTTRGIMMSRCIGPSLLLLDFEGFRRTRQGQDPTFQSKATLFALSVSDLVIVNIPLFDIGEAEGYATILLKIIFQEITKLPRGFTKILVVVRHYDGKEPFDNLRNSVEKIMEKIWDSIVGYLKFKDYTEVNIVGLPDKKSPKFQKEVTLLRQLLPFNVSSKVSSSGFSLCSSKLWDTIQQNGDLDIHQFYPGDYIFLSKSSITSKFSSGLAEGSSSSHSNNYSSPTEPKPYTFSQLQHMTNDFSTEQLIGTGGFGNVYKGVRDNKEVIAIKRLNSYPELSEKSFKNELMNHMVVQHKNIIRLLGYCSETKDKIFEHEGKLILAGVQEKALCFEYMEGGTLEKLLSDESCGLDWNDRYKIIKGICHGLKYLHTGFKDPIYHLDLKPANILLDEDRIAKIGDFGLSRLLDSAGTFVTKTFSGTKGYMPPEYIERQQVSPKFDVFSLGVIIIEVIAGENAYNNYKSEFTPPKEFTDNVTRNWRKREQAKPLSKEEILEVEKCIKMALRCVEDDRAKRPTITEVVEELHMIDTDAGDDATHAVLSI